MFRKKKPTVSLKQLKLNKMAERIANDYYNSSEFELYIDTSQIKGAGLGVFTEDDIPEDTIIDQYRGELIESFDSPENTMYYYELVKPNKETGEKGLGIDAFKFPRCYMAMINDACVEKDFTNNCEFEDDIQNKKINIITTRDINAGEELFVSYGEDYWK